LFLAVAAIGLAAALVLVVRANDGRNASAQPTVAALRTEVAQQQRTIEQLQGLVAAQQTPGNQANGPRSYLASFQIDKYSYVLYVEWDESDGFVRNGRLLTTDNYIRRGAKAYQLSGIDNHGSFGFTAQDQAVTITFSGKAASDGTVTLTGLPWNVFYGFVGGTFTQTLHPGTLQDYDTAVANLAGPPS
jgi:hypothetical protein